MIENQTDRLVARAKRAIRESKITEELVASMIGEIRELERLYRTEEGRVRDLVRRLQNSSSGFDTRGLNGDPRDRRAPEAFNHVEGWHDR